jgi:hypothetical protein
MDDKPNLLAIGQPAERGSLLMTCRAKIPISLRGGEWSVAIAPVYRDPDYSVVDSAVARPVTIDYRPWLLMSEQPRAVVRLAAWEFGHWPAWNEVVSVGNTLIGAPEALAKSLVLPAAWAFMQETAESLKGQPGKTERYCVFQRPDDYHILWLLVRLAAAREGRVETTLLDTLQMSRDHMEQPFTSASDPDRAASIKALDRLLREYKRSTTRSTP